MQQKTIGRYVLLERVGSTGLATVYRAQDPNQEGLVALKVLRPYMCNDEALLEKFSSVVKQAAKLSHPNILPVYRKENEGDMHWVVMQYASWPTLRQWLQGPIPAAQAMMILRQVAAAMEAAQLEGIHHGDIKPGNIFLDPETGQVVLSDFGLSILGEGAPPIVRTALRTPLPTYTAPERGRGSAASALSDIYSLGTLAYDMLTGTVPFNALDRASVQARQLTAVPPLPSRVNQDIPQQLDAVILKALAPHPELRNATAGEFIAALAAAAPVPEGDVAPFKIEDDLEPQRVFPGFESVETAPLVDDGPPIVCTVCGHSNTANAIWCTECWGVLDRVVAAAGETVYSSTEREQRMKKSARIRRSLLGSALAGVGIVLAVQFLNITLPLPAPSSDISSVSGPGEWAMIHRNFEGSGPVPGESADISGRAKWTFETSAPIVSVPAVKEGRVYLTTHDNRVVALDAVTGALIWEHETVAAVDSSPAVAGNTVFFGVRDKRVIALYASTGETRWEFVTEGNPTIGSPIVKDGVVYIGSGDGNIYAIDALTGEKRWEHPTQDWITNSPALSGNILAVSSFDGWVRTYDTETGKKRFSFRGLNDLVMGSPIIMGETIYVPYRNGLLVSVNLREEEVLFESRWYRLRLQLWLWGMADHPGLPKGVNWVARLGSTIDTTPTADEDRVYVPTQDGKLFAIDRLTGTRLWVFSSGTDNLSTPTLVENMVLVGDSQGALRAVDKDSGEERWSLQIAKGLTSTPVLAGGTVYLASKDGTLYAVE
ncbi:MAG: serine/threonine-protein kinase [Chloroflexi bacterium]|nr:serine/threonine-protein kinase [Chloroflexota bacterium]